MGSKINERMITELPLDVVVEELKIYRLSVAGTKKELRARLKTHLVARSTLKNPKADMKKAVALLLESYWFGWDDGKPHIFDKMFDKYGTFLPSVGKASSMVGTPDKHTSKINIGAKAEGQMVKMVLKNEGKSGLQRVLSTSPTLQQAFKDMIVQGVVVLIENDGKKFEFRKRDSLGDYYTFYLHHDTLQVRGMVIPRWAIG